MQQKQCKYKYYPLNFKCLLAVLYFFLFLWKRSWVLNFLTFHQLNKSLIIFSISFLFHRMNRISYLTIFFFLSTDVHKTINAPTDAPLVFNNPIVWCIAYKEDSVIYLWVRWTREYSFSILVPIFRCNWDGKGRFLKKNDDLWVCQIIIVVWIFSNINPLARTDLRILIFLVKGIRYL